MAATGSDEVMIQVRVIDVERDVLDDFVKTTGLSRQQVVRSMIHLLPKIGGEVVLEVENLPERPADINKRERTRAAGEAWARKYRNKPGGHL